MNCNRCGNLAVYSRKYSGESLCSLCFSDSIVKKMAKTISKYNMIKDGDVVGVAVSGAKDSDVDVIATGHNLDDILQTFIINVLSGDTNKIGWMEPITSNRIRKIKPFCEIYENEIVFYAFTNEIPFQSEQCPHMNEGIRTEIREFLNSLENNHSGIKNSMYSSVMRISNMVKGTNYKQRRICPKCGNECTGEICAVCNMLVNLKQA